MSHCPPYDRLSRRSLLVVTSCVLAALAGLAACSASSRMPEADAGAKGQDSYSGDETWSIVKGRVPTVDGPDRSVPEVEVARQLATRADLRSRAPAMLARPNGPQLVELPLETLRISTVLAGTRARTLVDCTFRNPYGTALEGRFVVRLPEGASPSSLGMFLGAGLASSSLDRSASSERSDAAPSGEPRPEHELLPPPIERVDELLERDPILPPHWSRGQLPVDWGTVRPARVVESTQGRQVYEAVTRPRIDPALMEWSGGNTFSTRVYPIPPRGLKRVYFVYDQSPLDTRDRLVVALPVPAVLPPGFRCEVAACARTYADAAVVTEAGERPLAGDEGAAYLKGEAHATSGPATGSFLLAARPRTLSVQAGWARTQGLPGAQVHARIRPQVALVQGERTGDAVFLLDTSLSTRTQLAASFGRLLRAILERDKSIERFQVVAFDVATRAITDGWQANTAEGREAVLREVERTWIEGATNLESALAWVERHALAQGGSAQPTLFLLSDAQVSWGLAQRRELERAYPRSFGARWVCYQVGDHAVDRGLLESLARAGGRVVPVLGDHAVDAAATAHRSVPVRLSGVRIEGAAAVDLLVAGAPRALHPGQVLEVAFRTPDGVLPPNAEIVVATSAGEQRFPLGGAQAADALAARAWAQATTNALLELEDVGADEIALALSQRFGLANRVASFLILETDDQYARHALEPAVLDLARLARAAADRQGQRPVGAPATASLAADAREFLVQLGAARVTPWPQPAEASPARQALAPPRWPDRLDPVAAWRDARERRAMGQVAQAVRVLSSIVEEAPQDAQALRLVGYALFDWGRYEEAAALFARARRLRPFEPQAFLCEALALEAMGDGGEAALRYELVLAPGGFGGRHGFVVEGARMMYARLLARLGSVHAAAASRRAALGLDAAPAEVEMHLYWSLDDTDVDLHVQRPGLFGREVYFDRLSSGAGTLHGDNTVGLGPEIYTDDADPSSVWVEYFGTQNVEGAMPASTLLVCWRRGVPRVHATVLAERSDKVVLWAAEDE